MTSLTVNTYEAKTRLSQLIAQAERGVEVTIARHGKPVVRLVPVDSVPKRELGFLEGPISEASNAALMASLDPDELALWERTDLP